MRVRIQQVQQLITRHEQLFLILIATLFSIAAIVYFFFHGEILSYGDAESHINIAKRVVDSITPGLAQLGGIWLPLPHLFMIPFVLFNPLWQTGLAGSIVAGISYVICSIYVYKTAYLLLNQKAAARIAFFVFISNPNILYLQSTPMSELPLLVFFITSCYYFLVFLLDDSNIFALILSSALGFCATLSRYDGWFLVLFQSIALLLYFLRKKTVFHEGQGKFVLFATLAFFGGILWLLWDFLILGDPLYFSNSPFSAKSQQQGWLLRGQLPAYKNAFLSFLYYFMTAFHNMGGIIFTFVLIGFLFYIFDRKQKLKFYTVLLLTIPFIFYWVTLYLGESVIFIPDLTPKSFPWRLFNVRYGIMMIPFAAFFFGYFSKLLNRFYRWFLIIIFLVQLFLFQSGIERVLAIDDGVNGLSAAKKVDAQNWMRANYDNGYILLDDYARTLSIIRSNLPIDKVIYVGNKPYWDESLKNPQKYATWIVLQKDDAVWNTLYKNDAQRGKLFKYFVKEYTSPEILIFKRNKHVKDTS